jgi:hypothetical protein
VIEHPRDLIDLVDYNIFTVILIPKTILENVQTFVDRQSQKEYNKLYWVQDPLDKIDQLQKYADSNMEIHAVVKKQMLEIHESPILLKEWQDSLDEYKREMLKTYFYSFKKHVIKKRMKIAANQGNIVYEKEQRKQKKQQKTLSIYV